MAKKGFMDHYLEQLKTYTTVVADTSDFESMRAYGPQDATTNPTLILKAAQQEQYRPLIERARATVEQKHLPEAQAISEKVDEVLVAFGCEILKIVPGRVSTEVDAHLSFDIEGTLERTRRLIRKYEGRGIDRDRVLIKIASTWEGIKAAQILEKEGIHCNLTLLFSLPQAIACAEAGVQLISPFVGRIYDWYKKDTGRDYQGADDPGVISVKSIYTYYKKFGYKTEIMGASFRNISEIIAIAGCDLLTISPSLLKELASTNGKLERQLSPTLAHQATITKVSLDEKTFRYQLNQDPMATEKLAEGIRLFSKDISSLIKIL